VEVTRVVNVNGDDIGGSGYSLEQLSAYRDRGRVPAIAAIDDNAECQAVLDSLDRMGELSRQLVEQDAADHPVDENWLAGLLGAIAFEVRAGHDIDYLPGSASDGGADWPTRLTITEGAVREIVRWAGDSVPGVLVGRVGIVGDARDPSTPVAIEVSISAPFGTPLTDQANAVRVAVAAALLAHTPLTVSTIDVTVTEVHQ
jgi:hypothetical protein